MGKKNRPSAKRPPRGRKKESLALQFERGAYYILLLWCLLPAAMYVNCLVFGLMEAFPTEAELAELGLRLGSTNYNLTLYTYQLLFFVLGAVTFLCAAIYLVLCRKRVFNLQTAVRMPWFYLLAFFLVWALICAVCADHPEFSLFGGDYMRDGYASYLIYGSVFLCASAIQNDEYRKKLLRTFTSVICCMALLMLLQKKTGLAFLRYCFPADRSAVFNQFNHFGYMLCTAIITTVGLIVYDTGAKKWMRCLYAAEILCMAYGLVVNNTFGAILAVLVGLPAVLVFYLRSGRRLDRRKVALALTVLLLAGVCFFALDAGKGRLLRNFTQLKTDLIKIITQADDAADAGTKRFGLWRETVKLIGEHPILGVGPEGLIDNNELKDSLLPHNTYLQIAAYTGFIGLFLYLAALLTLARDRWKNIRRLDPMVLVASGGAFTYLVSAFVGCPVFNTEPYLWLLLGFAAGARMGKKPLLCPGEGAETADETDVPSRPARTAQQCERISTCLMVLWCLLPAVMSVLFALTGWLGVYPTAKELRATGGTLGSINYAFAVKTYQTLFFVLGVITLLWVIYCLAQSRKRVFSLAMLREKPWFYLFAALLAWACISSFASDYYYHAFMGGTYVRDGLASYFIYASIFLCATTVRREDCRKRILRVFTAVISYLAMIMLIQELTRNDFIDYVFSSYRAVVFNQFNHFGYMLCMADICAVGLFLHDSGDRKWLRWLYLADALFLAYALVVNNTFGAILAVALSVPAVLLFYVRSGRRFEKRVVTAAFVTVALAIVCFFALSPNRAKMLKNFTQLGTDLKNIITNVENAGAAGTGRFELWEDTLQRISKRPVLGYGPEGFIGANAIADEKRPHNEYLQIAGYLGIPALLIYLAALFTLARHQWRRMKQLDPMVLVASGMTVAYLISAFVGNPVYNTAPYFWMFLGITAGVCADELPLLCPGEDTGGSRIRTHAFAALGAACCVLLCIPAAVSLKNERDRELEDLKAMLSAQESVTRFVGPEVLKGEIGYYWYDKKEDMIFPAYMVPPEPYGMGSPNSGGGTEMFLKTYGRTYDYDESRDYRGELILAVAVEEPGVGVKYALAWYNPAQ